MKYFFTNDILKTKQNWILLSFYIKRKNTKRRKCDLNKWL